jgi:general secretion pathway protein H
MHSKAVMVLMQTSAIGIWMVSGEQRGFTLLELMVTMFLVGIFSSFALLSLRGADENELLATEVQRLSALLEINQQEALLQGEQRGVYFTETGYIFMGRDSRGEWHPLVNSGFRTRHDLPAGMTLALWVDNLSIDLDKAPEQQPHVMLLSSGESTDFRVVFNIVENDIAGYWVASDLTGQLSMGAGQ